MELYTFLGKMIPASRNIVSEWWARTNLSSQSQVAKLDDIIVDKQVLRLHITMKEAVFMHAGESACDLIDNIPA